MLKDLEMVYHVWSGSFEDFETAYREVAEAGITSIVLTALRGNLDLRERDQAQEAKRILEALQVKAPACHCIDWGTCHLNESDADDHRAMIELHGNFMRNVAELDCKTYVLHIGHKPADGISKEQSMGQVRRALDALAPVAQSLNMVLALENGMEKYGYLVTDSELLALVADYDHPAVGICYDSGHAHITADAAATLHLLSPYVVTVHLHDNDGVDDLHLIPGQGTIDWPSVVKELAACPKLIHMETEAANCAGWPHSQGVWSYRDVYARYREIFN